jgi:hypothetical protein
MLVVRSNELMFVDSMTFKGCNVKTMIFSYLSNRITGIPQTGDIKEPATMSTRRYFKVKQMDQTDSNSFVAAAVVAVLSDWGASAAVEVPAAHAEGRLVDTAVDRVVAGLGTVDLGTVALVVESAALDRAVRAGPGPDKAVLEWIEEEPCHTAVVLVDVAFAAEESSVTGKSGLAEQLDSLAAAAASSTAMTAGFERWQAQSQPTLIAVSEQSSVSAETQASRVRRHPVVHQCLLTASTRSWPVATKPAAPVWPESTFSCYQTVPACLGWQQIHQEEQVLVLVPATQRYQTLARLLPVAAIIPMEVVVH